MTSELDPHNHHTAQTMGHGKISVLDGGLPRWIHEGYQVDSASVEMEIPLGIEVSVDREASFI
jgi:3-mercaptopyruvate sulfurtransferase SseA